MLSVFKRMKYYRYVRYCCYWVGWYGVCMRACVFIYVLRCKFLRFELLFCDWSLVVGVGSVVILEVELVKVEVEKRELIVV